MGRPNSLIFMHPTRSLMDKRGQQIFMPRPNSMMNAIKGKEVYKALMRKKQRLLLPKLWLLLREYWDPSDLQLPLQQSPYLSALDFCNSPVWSIEFLELDFWSISNLNFTGYSRQQNPVQNLKKISITGELQKSSADR